MSDYTPSTATVRECFLDGAAGEFVGVDFDRWLAAHDLEVARKAWIEGQRAEARAWEHIIDGHPVAEGEMCDECKVWNPYREGGAS